MANSNKFTTFMMFWVNDYVYRFVVFNDDILVLSLQEDCYYQISYYAKNINHCLNLRDGQLSFDYVLSQSTQILQL